MFAPPDGRRIDWSGEYREVTPPERLVFTVTDQIGDDAFELVAVVLIDLGDGRTEMHFAQRGSMSPRNMNAQPTAGAHSSTAYTNASPPPERGTDALNTWHPWIAGKLASCPATAFAT
jgi:uncharacterized protein YndB with AHSA1/START domain